MSVTFQVDPGFYDHPRTAGMTDAAFSLWVRAGSYSAAHRTAGHIPRAVLTGVLNSNTVVADELVERGLWRRCAGGHVFERIGWFIGSENWRPWIPMWLRRLVMERDGHQCVECGGTERLSLDHIDPWSKGGPDTEENLRVLCMPCNIAKGAR